MTRKLRGVLVICAVIAAIAPAWADDLFSDPHWAGIASDQSAREEGDLLTVIVIQNAEARNAAQNTARTRRSFDGSISGGALAEDGQLSLEGAYAGQGEVRRSESFITQISVVIEEVLPNGDYRIAGQQNMHVNGERTIVRLRGRVRPIDITGGNEVLSTRIAEAEISYDGRGFVSRNARPNLIHRILSLLGLGG
jgi:flagellar L-ring protein precursor FlgH